MGAPRTGGFRFDLDNDTYVSSMLPEYAWALQERDAKGVDSDTKQGHLIVANTLTAESFDAAYDPDKGRGLPVVRSYVFDPNQITRKPNRSRPKEGTSHTLPGQPNAPYLVRAFQPRIARNGRGAPDEVAKTLSAQAGETGKGDAAQYIIGTSAIRRLTPLECERLQGFPDGWTCVCGAEADIFACKCPDGPRYRALGNAVTTTIPRWFAPRMVAAFG